MDGILPDHGLPVQASSELARLQEASRAANNGDAQEAATMFEELLATMLVKELRSSLPGGFFGGGAGTGIMDGWFDEHLGQSLAEGWDLDLAGLVRVGIEQKSAEAATEEQ